MNKNIVQHAGIKGGGFLLLSIIILTILICSQHANALVKDWPFTTPGDYTYDATKIDVSGGMAGLITQGWMDDDWLYRREIIIDNTAGGAAANLQVLIELDNTNFDFASATANGYDIRFTDSDMTTPIDFWRQSYDSVGETAQFYVEIPNLPAAAVYSIYIYYGNPAAADASNYSSVFFHVGEFGYLSEDPMSSNWTAVNFSTALDVNPVVVSSLQTAVDTAGPGDKEIASTCGGGDGYADGTAEPQLRNVTMNGFELNTMTKSIDCDNTHGAEKVGWVALEQGTYYVGDRLFRVFTQNFDGSPAEENNTINFGYTFSDLPVILPQIQTDANSAATSSIRLRTPTQTQVIAKIEGERDSTVLASAETVGFVVAEQGGIDDVLTSNFGDGLEGEVGSTPEGSMNNEWNSTTFQHTFAFPPVVILKTQYDNGGNNGLERLRNISNSGFQQKFEETFYATSNSYDGIHFNDEGGTFLSFGGSDGLSGWQYRRRYTITNATGADLTNYTVRLNLTAANFNFANAQPDGDDIRFMNAAGTTYLPYWFHATEYDSVGQTATIYVKVPLLPNGAGTDIYVYYGNPTATSEASYEDTFTLVGEAGRTTANSITTAWYTVYYRNDYTAAPVTYTNIVTQNHVDGDESAHTRTRNVFTLSAGIGRYFQMRVEEARDEDNTHAGETGSWLALQSGSWLIGGRRFEVMRVTNVDEVYDNVNFPSAFGATPAVIANAETAVNQWQNSSSHTRINNVTVNGLQITAENCRNPEAGLGNETMAIIAAETGAGDRTAPNGLESARVNRTSAWSAYNYASAFPTAPAIGTTINIEGGGGSAQASHIRIKNATTAAFDSRIQEYSNGTAHPEVETTSLIAMGQGSVYGRQYVNPVPAMVAAGEENLGVTPPPSRLIYARQYVANPPTNTVQSSETYNLDPAIIPIDVQGVAFDEISAFAETLGPGTGDVRYQASNDNVTWFYWSGADWVASDLSYAQANDAATVNANIGLFDDPPRGDGTFYFRAILHAPTENDDIALDHVQITYTVPPPAPDIFGITPNPGLIGGTVTITGGDFGASQVAVGGKVYFNGCDAGVAGAWSDNSITVTVPTCATNGPVTVYANGYLSNEFAWTIAVPSISFLDPASGDFFQLVWIYGDNFGYVQGNSYVTFQSGLYAQVLSWSNTQIRVVVPSGAATGDVEVVTAGGTSNGVNFNITPDQSRWPFTYAANYTYDPALITVTGGMAELVPINVPTWYSRRWLYRRPITVNNATGGPLTNFVVEINLTNANFSFSKARDSGQDVRITRGDGTTFENLWIESWSQAGETARLWMRCTNLAAGANTFYIYYGNSAAPSVSDYLTTLDRVGEAQRNVTSSDTNWVNRTFSNAFSAAPVVIGAIQTQNSATEAHTRLRNITTTAFDIKVENSSNAGNTHSAETMGWIALEQGSWVIGDLHVEVGTQGSVDENPWQAANFANAFTAAPGVIAVQQTAAVSDNTTGSMQLRVQSVTTNGFQAREERDDDSQPGEIADETAGYIAMDYGTFDTSLPNLKGQIQASTMDSPNIWYFENVNITSGNTSTPVVIPTVITAGQFGGEDPAHARMKSITPTTFQLQIEECRNAECTEGHNNETFSWLAMDSGIIYGHPYVNPMPAAAVGGEQEPIYSTANPTIEPATDGESFDGLAGFFELIGYENVGNVRYQITNDVTKTNWYYHTGAAWATATVGNIAQTDTNVDVNDYIYSFDGQYGTGTFFFKAYLVSDGAQLVQLDGIGIIERTEVLSNYNWATNTVPPPIFFGDYINVGLNPDQEYLLAVQVQHDGATGTYNFRLQYQEDPFGTPGPWTSITTATSKWKAVNGVWGAHNDTVPTAQYACAAGLGAATEGIYTETGIVNTYEFGSGTIYAEFWYAIMPDATANNKEYRFRVVNGTSSSNFHYSVYPQAGPPPAPLTLTIDNKINGNYTDDPILDLTMTCDDQPNVTYGACDASDFMRHGCSLTGVNAVATQSYVVTPPSYAYNLAAAPPLSDCTAADGLKIMYFQAQNERTYLQPNPATDSVILDTTPPDISTATLYLTADQGDVYFKGTTDGVNCDPALNPACTVWFNSNAGQGAGQLLTVTAVADPAGNIDENPWKFQGAVAFGDTLAADTSAAGDWLVDSYSVEVNEADQLGVVFTFTDMVNKTDTFTVDFQRDSEAPETVDRNSTVNPPQGWDTSLKTTTFADYDWISYPNPYFEWAAPLDLPYGVDQSSGFWRYQSWVSTDPAFVPSTYTLANFITATGPLQNGYLYFVPVVTHDYVTNKSTPTWAYTFRYDGLDPYFDYNAPATGGATIWYSEDPGGTPINIDVGWASGSPLVDYYYRVVGSSPWLQIWPGAQSADYTTDWAVAWGFVTEGNNQIAISAHDESGRGATETYALNTSGFLFRRDSSAPEQPGTANGWDTLAKAVAVNQVSGWPYTQPYFEWAAPDDNPVGVNGTDNAGVAGYRVAFSTDANYVPATSEYQTAATYTAATAAVVCGNYYLRIRSVDAASPNNVSAATTAFTYIYTEFASVTDNQTGDNTWYSPDVLGVTYNVDFSKAAGCGNLDRGQYTVYSAAAGGGVMRKDWTNIFGPAYGAQTYSTDWPLDFASLAEGTNYVSARAYDQYGIATSATDVFYVRIDASAPDNLATPANGWEDGTKAVAIVDGGSYTHDNPYFEWSAPADNPVAGNAGVAGYLVAFSTDPDYDPTAMQTATAYSATPTVCGATYTLVVKAIDAATPTPNVAATTTKLFTYYYECKTVPDYIVVTPEEDGIAIADHQITDWCDDGSDGAMADCATVCTGKYCSNTSYSLLNKPEYVKYNDGIDDFTLTYHVDDVAPPLDRWSWDTVNERIMIRRSPTAATVTYTENSGSEKVCVAVYDKDDLLITTGKYSTAKVHIDLSQAPNSGKDITENMSPPGTVGFSVINDIAGGDIDFNDQIYLTGQLTGGDACFRVTAESTPNDTPNTPIRIDAAFYDPDTGATYTMLHFGGNDTPGFVRIVGGPGVSATSTNSAPAVTDVDTSIWDPSPANPSLTITLNPVWNNGGTALGFISRQTNPCGGAAAVGDAPYDNFNIFLRKQAGGVWTDCVRLTRNTTDGIFSYGPLPGSEITFSPADDKVVFAATDLGGSGGDKLYWVSATSSFAGAATGTHYNYVVKDPLSLNDILAADANAGDNFIFVSFPSAFAIGQEILIGNFNFLTGVYDSREANTITGINVGTGQIDLQNALARDYDMMTATTMGQVEYPVPVGGLGHYVSPMSDQTNWYDPAWSPSDAGACTPNADPITTHQFGDVLLALRWPPPTGVGDYVGTPPGYTDQANANANIIMLYGGKNADGIYQHGVSKIAKITDFSGETIYPLKPKWSPDCTKIAFVAWDVSGGTSPSKSGVYVINLADERAGWSTATLPITSLSDTGVYEIYDFADNNDMPAYFPNWSADSTLVSYSVDTTKTLDIAQFRADNDDLVNTLYGAINFDTYLEYIEDQPPALGAITSPQIIGAATSTAGMRNEFGMAQCPGELAGSACPNGPNYPWSFVSQTAGSSGDLRALTIENVSTVTANGGLLFLDGIVTAVFPPGVISTDTVFWNEWPTQYCTGAAPAQNAGGGAGNCPIEPTGEYIVNAGEAREFFPDGTNFDGQVRLIFHYCDNDDDGFIDTGTEGTQKFGFSYNSGTSTCGIAGIDTATGTIDVDSLAVYNWDDAAAQWVKLEGAVDKVGKTITVYSTHFSRYDTFGFRVGGAPQVVTPLQLVNVHTYPNPWYTTQGVPVKFAADTAAGDGSILVDIKIYDIRGGHVATIQNVVTGGGPGGYGSENNAVTIANWTPTNFAGTPLASGVYLYYLHATDLTNGTVVDVTGKLSIIH